MIKYILFIVFLAINSARANDTYSDEQLATVANSMQWRFLLHFTRDAKPGDHSEVHGGDFFLSANGARDPLSELRATIAHLNDAKLLLGPLKQPPICALRARYQYLKKTLGLELPNITCEKWQQFVERFKDPRGLSLVFSSAYTNNPASMFGHLFIKVESARGNDLLDQGINFAANVPPDESPFAFFYFGVFGGYYGHWSIQPYYEKINEYIQAESRDLWEYRLNLTAEETNFFIEHVWELETTGLTKYYFFDLNCAYQMMRALEAVRPDWDLGRHRIYAIPGELTKNLNSLDDIVREVKFRPALRKALLQRYRALNHTERTNLFRVLSRVTPPESVQSAAVLETANSYFAFRRQRKKGVLDKSERELWDQILGARANLGEQPARELPPVSKETRPDLGHDAYAFSPFLGFERTRNSELVASHGVLIKSAYHDLLNNDNGFKRFSEILFPWVEFRYRPSVGNLQIEELGGIRIRSFSPVERLDFKPSWKAGVAIETPKELGCVSCRALTGEAGLGLSWASENETNLVYQFVTMRTATDPEQRGVMRITPVFEVGWIGTTGDWLKTQASAAQGHELTGSSRGLRFYDFTLQQAYFVQRNFDIRPRFRWIFEQLDARPIYNEGRIDFAYYFR